MAYRDPPARRPPRDLVLYNNRGRARRYVAMLAVLLLLAVWIWDAQLMWYLVGAAVFCAVMAVWSLLFRLQLTAYDDDDLLRVQTWQWPFRHEERSVRLSCITGLVAHFDELGAHSLRLVAQGEQLPIMLWPEDNERDAVAHFLGRLPDGPTS